MDTQTTLRQEEVSSSQADFIGVFAAPNGVGTRLLPGEEHLAEKTSPFVGPPLASISGEQTTEETVEVEGELVVSVRDARLPVTCRGESSPAGGQIVSYFDRAETLLLRTASDAEELNIVLRYTGKPLDAALESARFLDDLMGTPGRLAFEVPLAAGAAFRFEIGDLPLPVPGPFLEAHRNRLEVLEALHEILLATGVEIRYPEDTEDDQEGLGNLNFVRKAIRGGWVASSVDGFTTHLAPAEVRVLAEELARYGEVGRAFLFDLPEEAYDVFGTTVNLGPSRRYLAAARLLTGREEMERWLGDGPGSEERLDLSWEPADGVHMHVFFGEWPKTSLGSVHRELREFEVVYGVGSERFRQGRERGEAWVRDIQDANRWFALLEARAELAGGS